MQVFSSRSIKRCFAVPAARFIYATADQLVVAEIDQLHLIGGCDAVLTPTNQRRDPGVAAARHVPTFSEVMRQEVHLVDRENRVISYWYGLWPGSSPLGKPCIRP